MTFLNLAKERYSVRKFSEQKVEQEKLEAVLEAGRIAPTAVNYQPQRIVVLNDAKELEKVKKTTKFTFDAPVILIVCYDKTASWKNPFGNVENGEMDATIVTTQMMLEAHELGLGTTFVGYFNGELLREEFNIPEYLVPIALLPLGYPAEEAKPSRLHGMRKDIKETVFYNSFEGIEAGNTADTLH